MLATRIADLAGYQDRAYADRYAEEVRRVTALATGRAGHVEGARVGAAYARGLHKLMAYKDEYEVARLHLDPVEVARREAEYGAGRDGVGDAAPAGAAGPGRAAQDPAEGLGRPGVPRAARRPPAARHPAGRVRLGRRPPPRARAGRGVPVGRAQRVRAALPGHRRRRGELAGTPDLVRGYEDVKLANVERYRERVAELLAGLAGPPALGTAAAGTTAAGTAAPGPAVPGAAVPGAETGHDRAAEEALAAS